MILVEILGQELAANGAAIPRSLYLGDKPLMTRAVDTPANVTVYARLASLPSFKRNIGGDGGNNALIGGAIEPGFGALAILNPDGQFDHLLGARWLLDAKVRVHAVAEPLPSPLVLSDATTLLFAARAGVPEFDENRIDIPLHPGAVALDKPLLAQWDAAISEAVTDPTTAAAIAGQRLPRLYGIGGGLTPLLVDATRNLYLVSDRPAAITAAYDRGSKITGPADGMPVANLAALLNSSPAAGAYRYWSGLGVPGRCYIRLGSPAQALTVWATAASAINLVNGAAQPTPAAATINTAVQAILTDVGMGADYVANPASWLSAFAVGWYGNGDESAQDAIRYLLASVDGYWGLDRFGKFRIGKIEQPGSSALPVAYQLPVSLVRSVACHWRNGGAECAAWTIKHSRNWSPQQSVAAALDSTTAARHTEAWASLKLAGPAPRQGWEIDNTLETALYDGQAVQWLAEALLDRYRGKSRLYSVELGATDALLTTLDVGQCVQLTYSRFDLQAGKALLLLDLDVDLDNAKITMELWG